MFLIIYDFLGYTFRYKIFGFWEQYFNVTKTRRKEVREMKSTKEFNPVVQLYLAVKNSKEERAQGLDPCVAELCYEVHKGSSLYKAAKKRNISYSNAWNRIKKAETSLGIKLLIRESTRSMKLTFEGEKIINHYMALQEKLDETALQFYGEIKKQV